MWEESFRFYDTNFSLTCDGCHYVSIASSVKGIMGIANLSQNFSGLHFKCLNEENFDYCSFCIDDADTTHPGHLFIRLHEIPRDEDRQEKKEDELAVKVT